MANQLSLIWDLIAVDHASGTFERVGATAEKTASAMKGLMAGFTAIAVGEAVKTAISQAAEFQKQMTLVQTQAGATAQEVRNLTPAILSLAGQTAQAPEALANSLYHVESTGLRGAAALQAVKMAAEGAKVGNADLEQTTNALTATIASGMLPATETYSQAMGQLNTIVGSGDMKMQDLNDALSTGLLVTVKQYGVNLNDVGAALADFGDNNLRGADAATRLRMAVQALSTQSAHGQGVLMGLGIKVNELADDMAKGGLNLAIQDLMTHLQKSGVAASQWGQVLTEAFTKKAGAGVLTLVGTFDRFENKYKEVSKGADTFGQAWQATTKTASFQFSQLKDTVDALGISFGTKLLPVAGDLAQWLSQTGIPDVQKFSTELGGWFTTVEHSQGWQVFWSTTKTLFTDVRDDVDKLVTSFSRSGGLHDSLMLVETAGGLALGALKGLVTVGESTLGTLVHWFTMLPGPVQASVVAFVALRTATNLGWFDKLIGSEGSVLSVLRNVGGGAVTMAGQMRTSFGVAKQAQMDLMGDGGLGGTMVARATGNLAGLGAAAGEAAKGGFTALKSAGAGLMGLMGGPWGVAIAGATVGITVLMDAIQRHDEAIKQATSDVQKWNEAIALGGGGQSAVTAAQHLQDLRDKLAAVTQQIDAYNAAAQSGNARGGIGSLVSQQQELKSELDKGTAAWKEQLAAMSPVQEAQARVDQAMQDLTDAEKHNAPTSEAVTNAHIRLSDAESRLAVETGRATDAQKTQIQQMADNVNTIIASADAQAAAVDAQSQLNDALKNFRSLAQPSTSDQNTLADAARNYAQQQATAAAAVAKAKGVTDTGTTSQQAYLKALQDAATQMGMATPASISDLIGSLQKAMGAVGQTVGDFQHLGAQSDEEKQKLQDLGFVIATLPDGSVVVTADTNPAKQEIVDLLNYARVQSIQYRATLPSLVNNSVASGSGRPGMATGGQILGAGSTTSDSIPIMVSNREFIVNAAATEANLSLLHAINSGKIRGFANGGWTGLSPDGTFPVGSATIPVSVVDGGYKAAVSQYLQQATTFTGGGGGAGSPFIRLLGQAIAATMGYASQFNAIDYIFSHESGWNPLAQNPTSTAFGIPQFLDSTWGAYGGKTTDAAQQIRDGLMYMRDRYGSPNAAAAFWQAHHWYRDGTNYVPSDQLAVLHRGEAVVPASKNQGAPYRSSSGPLMHVEHMHVNDQVDLDLALQQAEFRDRVGAFSL